MARPEHPTLLAKNTSACAYLHQRFLSGGFADAISFILKNTPRGQMWSNRAAPEA